MAIERKVPGEIRIFLSKKIVYLSLVLFVIK